MVIAVGIFCLVFVASLEGITDFPDQHHVIENQTEVNNAIWTFGDAGDYISFANRNLRTNKQTTNKQNTGVCHYGETNTPHQPNTVIDIIPKNCHKILCDENGKIQHIYPLGRQENCCKCHDHLYSKGSHTCQYKKQHDRCPDPCVRDDGKEFANGMIVETIPLRCAKKRCKNGNATEELIFPGLTGCCLDERNQMRKPGSVDNDGCLQRICTDSIWVLNPKNINKACKKCSARNDPHFIDFSEVEYDWHVGCNHVLVQDDINRNDPTFGVFMDFNLQSTIANIGGPTTYQEDMDTTIILTPGRYQVLVNRLQQLVNSNTPVLLVGPNGETTVYAWKTTSTNRCVRLYGKHNILVELCRWSIAIWAAPWSLGDMPLTGLCGSTTASALAEKKLVARNGDKYELPGGYYPDAPNAFGLSWQADQQTKASCPKVRTITRSTRAEEDIRKGCSNVTNSPDNRDCLAMVDNAGLTGDDREHFLYTCMFDLCIAVADPEAGFTRKEMLEQNSEIAEEFKSHADNTIEFASGRVKCPYGWSPVGEQCFQWHNFEAGLSFDDAQNNCNADFASLAHPHDVAQINKFIKGSYWLGALHMEGDMEWIVGGGQVPKDQYLIGVPRYNTSKPNNCLEIQLPTTASNGLIEIIFKQSLEILAKQDDSVNFESKVYFSNGNNKLKRMEGTNTTMECIKPQVYVCEREPLVCGNEDDNCAWLASNGECKASMAYMYNTCKESCNVPCVCEQPLTCTDVGGMCQSMGAICDDVSDSTLCANDNCTCCYFPDPCQDSGDKDCNQHKLDGLCASTDVDVIAELKKHCSRTCGICDPLY